MKWTSLLFLLFLAPMPVNAQTLGCFVEASDPTQCSIQQAHCASTASVNIALFGVTMGDLCARLVDQTARTDESLAGWGVAIDHWKACGETVGQLEGARQYYYDIAVYEYDLIQRLYKKCGSRCRKVQ